MCESDDHEHAAWCGAQSDGAGGAASFGQAFERRRVAMTEGKAKPVRQRSVAQCVQTDGIPASARGRERYIANKQISEDRSKRSHALRG